MTKRTTSSHGGVPLDEEKSEKSPEANSQDAHDVGVNAHARPSNSPRNLGICRWPPEEFLQKLGVFGPWWSSDKACWPIPFSRNLRGASCHSDWKGETEFQLQSLVALHLMFLAKSCIYQKLRATSWLDVVPFHLNEDLRDKLRSV